MAAHWVPILRLPIKMKPRPIDQDLRDALEQITMNYRGRDVRGQLSEVEQLRGRHGHSLKTLVIVDDASPGPSQYTCFMHALELSSPPTLMTKIMDYFEVVYPGSEFIQQLLDLRLLKETLAPRDGDVVLYFKDGIPKHAAKMQGEALVSKWGLGHVWQHSLFEVPSSYGDTVRTFERVERGTAEAWFMDYATRMVGVAKIAEVRLLDA